MTIAFEYTVPVLIGGAGSIAGFYKDNPFGRAYEEAISVGSYLGYMIAREKIFGDCQINLVGFSLGTLVIQHIVNLLDKLNCKVVN